MSRMTVSAKLLSTVYNPYRFPRAEELLVEKLLEPSFVRASEWRAQNQEDHQLVRRTT